jgi:pyruvate kinase
MIAEKIDAAKIVSVTESGSSCLRISQFRPSAAVLGVTNSIRVARKMCLYWGVTPFLVTEQAQEGPEFMKNVLKDIKDEFKLKNGDKLVLTKGDGRFFSQGSSNSVKVEIIKDTPKIKGGSQGLLEGSDDKKKILLDTTVCASCQACIQVCPHGIWAASKDEAKHTYLKVENVSRCAMDMACVESCPTGAIEIIPTSF